jgi:putative transposase
MQINRSRFYAWLLQPKSSRQSDDERLLVKIKQCWLKSGFAYGYCNITKDLKDLGESCGKNRVNCIMRQSGIQSKRRYKEHQGFKAGMLLNVLGRQFSVMQPNQVWVTDFTYIRTHEGWLEPEGLAGA